MAIQVPFAAVQSALVVFGIGIVLAGVTFGIGMVQVPSAANGPQVPVFAVHCALVKFVSVTPLLYLQLPKVSAESACKGVSDTTPGKLPL